MQFYRYQGRRLHIADGAEIPTDLMPRGRNSGFVQQLLNTIEPWEGRQHTIRTKQFEKLLHLPTALKIKPGKQRQWGVYVGHEAESPGLSPFVQLEDALVDDDERQLITVELTGGARRPVLVRAVHGGETPPVPWMTSAKHWHKGLGDCVSFWNGHGYRLLETSIVPGTLTDEPPEWFTS